MKNLIIIGIIGICLIAAICFYRQEMLSYQKQAEIYHQNTNVLIARVRRIYEEKIKLQQDNQALEQATEQDKGYFNWYTDISRTEVIKRLRQN